MQIRIEIETSDFENALINFIQKKVDKGLKDCKAIAELIRDDIQENIINARKVPSGNLKKNAESTIKAKGFDAPLIDTGLLHDSILISEVQNGYEISIGSVRKNIAEWNHYGTKTIPARPFFGIRRAIKKDIRNILNG